MLFKTKKRTIGTWLHLDKFEWGLGPRIIYVPKKLLYWSFHVGPFAVSQSIRNVAGAA